MLAKLFTIQDREKKELLLFLRQMARQALSLLIKPMYWETSGLSILR